jgi:DNA invertase Pin-like site-specific DNA recombinase
MDGKRIGYVRVSTADQNIERQLDGMQLDKVYVDKLSGKDVNRPQLQAMIEFVRAGDSVIIHSLDRLGRNLRDLRDIVDTLTGKGVSVTFIKENMTLTGDDSSMSKLLLSIMGAFAEFERNLILERQREGIAIAKAAGAYKGRKKSLNEDQIRVLKDRIKSGSKKAEIAREFKISRETLYQYIRE